MKFLITGGAGFIGSAVVDHVLEKTGFDVINIDKLTYAADPQAAFRQHPRYKFSQTDICDAQSVRDLLSQFRPDVILHLAAESHVDRSIDSPAAFLDTNISGTFTVLEEALRYWKASGEPETFRFHHVSTDEVFGDLEDDEPAFSESHPYRPSSPYSASKAASDHLVRAWHRTYGLPTLISNCSNNYGPRQFPEKLIPLMILNAIDGRPLPVYGDGMQSRDWLHVEDHAEALLKIATRGKPGETYNVGGRSERRNIEVVETICEILFRIRPAGRAGIDNYRELIKHVPDRPGHDRRYAIDDSKIANELGWAPRHSFESGMESTVRWYLDNADWCEDITSNRYDRTRIGKAGRQ